jgi:hypothetical protein
MKLFLHRYFSRQWLHKFSYVFFWIIFLLWLPVQVPTFLGLAEQGQMPIDFLAYHRAAQALEGGESPYLSPTQTLHIWRSFHQNEMEMIDAQEREGRGQAVLQEQAERPQQPGPYLYPPTLARLLVASGISPLFFAVLTLLSILSFSWLWLRSTGGHSVWLLLVILSLDVLASLNGGNVELLLLFATLLAGWLLWHRNAFAAAPLIAFVILVKPFYALFFPALLAIEWTSQPGAYKSMLKTWFVTGLAALALLALEVYAWGEALRADTFQYIRHALDYQWFVLPVAEQTPMSIWNRTPFQALISAGMPATTAQFVAPGIWILFVAFTVWYLHGKRLSFALAFALALVLLYWGRPVGWSLVYLELIVVVALWPRLQRKGRWLLLGSALALLLSHWAALVTTALGHGMQLLTLQTADFPWETWLILPLCWLLLLYGAADCLPE